MTKRCAACPAPIFTFEDIITLSHLAPAGPQGRIGYVMIDRPVAPEYGEIV